MLHSLHFCSRNSLRFVQLTQWILNIICRILETDWTIESKIDSTISRVNQNSKMMTHLQIRLDEGCAKTKHLENRSLCYNIPIQGLPKTITDLEESVHTLMKDLIPDILPHQLDIERVHQEN